MLADVIFIILLFYNENTGTLKWKLTNLLFYIIL